MPPLGCISTPLDRGCWVVFLGNVFQTVPKVLTRHLYFFIGESCVTPFDSRIHLISQISPFLIRWSTWNRKGILQLNQMWLAWGNQYAFLLHHRWFLSICLWTLCGTVPSLLFVCFSSVSTVLFVGVYQIISFFILFTYSLISMTSFIVFYFLIFGIWSSGILLVLLYLMSYQYFSTLCCTARLE